MTGRTGYLAGLTAEDRVAARYVSAGGVVRHRRWRGTAGEIDLIVAHDGAVVFVEVKKARDFAAAAARISQRQAARILAAAEEFAAGEPDGSLTEMRVDVALVDQAGRVEILENALGA